jgi:hypothetical protein
LGSEQDDSAKVYGLEQSVNFLSKSIGKNLNPLPDYDVGKESSAKFSFSKDNRFKDKNNSDLPGPNIYFYEKEEHYNKYRLDNLTYF